MSDAQSQWYASGDTPAPQAYLEYVDAATNFQTIIFDVVISEDWPDQGTTVTEHNVEVGADVADHVRVKLATCELKIYSSNEPLSVASGLISYGVIPTTPTRTGVVLDVPTVRFTSSPQVLSFQAWDNPIALRELIGDTYRAIGGATGSRTGAAVGQTGGDLTTSLLLQAQAVPMIQAVDAQISTSSIQYDNITVQVDTWGTPTDFVARLHGLLLDLKNAATQFTVVGTKQAMSPMVIESLAFHRDKDTGSGEEITIGFKQVRIVTTDTVPNPTPFLPGGGGKAAANKGVQGPVPVTNESAAHDLVAKAAPVATAIGNAIISFFSGGS